MHKEIMKSMILAVALAALPVFEKHGAHASFFVCGAIDAETLTAMRRLRAVGRTVGIHTVGQGNALEEILAEAKRLGMTIAGFDEL